MRKQLKVMEIVRQLKKHKSLFLLLRHFRHFVLKHFRYTQNVTQLPTKFQNLNQKTCRRIPEIFYNHFGLNSAINIFFNRSLPIREVLTVNKKRQYCSFGRTEHIERA